jgi:hypothetical protein
MGAMASDAKAGGGPPAAGAAGAPGPDGGDGPPDPVPGAAGAAGEPAARAVTVRGAGAFRVPELPRGLDPTRPPTHGALAAVDEGWLLRSEQGVLTPRSTRGAGHATLVGGTIVCLGAAFALSEWFGFLNSPRYLKALTLWAVVFGSWSAARFALRRATAWRVRRRLARAEARSHLDEARDGSLVRVTGVVESAAPFESLVTGLPAVLARSRRVGSHGPFEALRGIDFDLRLEAGTRVRVAVRHAFLADEPHGDRPTCHSPTFIDLGEEPVLLSGGRPDPIYSEARVGPGDVVEVVGLVSREVDPAGEAGPGRGPPMSVYLRGTETVALLVRRVTGA